MANNFLKQDTIPQIEEAQGMQNRINNKQQTKPIQTHDKQTTENQVERENLDGNQRKIDSLQRGTNTEYRITTKFFSETIQTRIQWSKIFKVLK